MKTKRNLIHIWLLGAAMLPAVVQAQFTFTTNNGAITITGYTGPGGNVTIPDTTNGYPVTSIGSGALYNQTTVTGVIIPYSVTNIGDYPFDACSGLTNIAVDAANPNYASASGVLFNKSLTTLIEYPGGLTDSYVIPNSVTNIGDYAFFNCSGLTNVTIGSSVASIGDAAFAGSHLATVTIGSSVASIGASAFFGCDLTSVTIPNSVTNIGQWAFENCPLLNAAYFEGNAPTVGGGPGSADYTVFVDDYGPSFEKGTVYYLPGTTGWGSNFGGWPTVVGNAQTLLTFDDLPSGGPLTTMFPGVPNSYGGLNLNWDNFGVANGLEFDANNGDGYYYGVVSPSNAVFNLYGDPASISIPSGLFDLNSAYLTAAGDNYTTLNIQVEGFVGATMVYSNTYTVTNGGPTLINFDYVGVDSVTFIAGVGWASWFVMDNVTITEPSALPAAPPAITVQPQSQTNYAGATVTFLVSATSLSPLSYQWQKNGTNLVNGGNISGATINTLTITGILDSDAAIYSVIVSNSINSVTSSNATLTVNDSPFITMQPLNQTVGVGSNVTFTAATYGAPPFTFQWYFNASPVGSPASSTNVSSYTLTGVQTNQSGNYSVLVSNSYNSVMSSNAVLTVEVFSPVVTVQPQSQTNYAGATVTFLVSATSPSHLSYQWQKNGTNLVNGGNISDATINTLTITGISDSDAAAYSVIVSNSNSSVTSSNATLTVNDSPFIATQPLSQTAGVGSYVTFTAATYGTPPFTFQWYYNDSPVGSPTSGTNVSSYTLTDVNTNQSGNYSVLVSNGYGSVMSSNAVLTVVVFPPGNVVKTNALVGEWLNGSANLADVSDYSPPGTHDGYAVGGGNYVFTNDVPPGKTGQSLFFYNGDTAIAISNSSTLDANYTNTFDDQINTAFTISCWGRGFPAAWSPWVSKWGDFVTYPDYSTTSGWQLRQYGSSGYACFTVRDNNAGGLVFGNASIDLDDLASTYPSNDGGWHFYAGTFNANTGVRNLYVDGTLAAQETNNVAYTLAAAEHLVIGGKDSAPGNSFGFFSTFEIYDVRIYNYALTNGVLPPPPPPPYISVQPQSVSVFTNTSAQFRATARGAAPLVYQWTLNGTDVNLLSDSANFTGANSNILTVLNVTTNDAGSYRLIVTNNYGSTVSSNAVLAIEYPSLVGEWLNGSTNFADVSGYSPPGTHDGFAVGGQNYQFSSDVPPGYTGQSLTFPNGDTGIAISNSSTMEPGYTNTFDGAVSTYITVSLWAKGSYPAYTGWPAFLSKNGESGGWEMRYAQWGTPCWTVRDQGTGTMVVGNNGGWDGNDDMSAPNGIDGNWHLWTGTYNSVTGNRYLYIDGVAVANETGNKPYIPAPASHVTIGCEDGGNGSYGAYCQSLFKLYDLRIYNYELTAIQNPVPVLPTTTFDGTPTVTTGPNGPQFVLTWNTGTLLQATNAAGPWTPVAGATPPYTNLINMTAPNMFYKLSNP